MQAMRWCFGFMVSSSGVEALMFQFLALDLYVGGGVWWGGWVWGGGVGWGAVGWVWWVWCSCGGVDVWWCSVKM